MEEKGRILNYVALRLVVLSMDVLFVPSMSISVCFVDKSGGDVKSSAVVECEWKVK